MGLFRVRNIQNGKWLIGTSVNLPGILNRTRFQLEHGSHPNRALQQEWNELGADAFDIEILDTLKPSNEPGYNPSADLRVLEEIWFERLAAEAPGYADKPQGR
jgi:hypothetical protein